MTRLGIIKYTNVAPLLHHLEPALMDFPVEFVRGVTNRNQRGAAGRILDNIKCRLFWTLSSTMNHGEHFDMF